MLVGLIIVGTLMLLVLGLPIYIALIFPAAIVIFNIFGVPITVLAQQMFASMDKFALMSMPFFILAANLMTAGGLNRRIVRLAVLALGSFRGGLALATQVSTMFFGALSGSSPATVAAIGKVMYPTMIDNNYPKGFTAGLICTSGAVAILIPPSITMIVYASITGASVARLFLAGIGAGLIFGFFTLAYIVFYVNMKKLPTGDKVPISEVWGALKEASWALGVPVLIIGGIYFGIFTPTEAAGISAVYAAIIGFVIYRDLTIKLFFKICYESAVISAQLMLLTASAGLLGWVFMTLQVPQTLTALLLEFTNSPIVFLLMINIFGLLLGMFINGVPAVVIVAPLIAPLAVTYGIDVVHFGIILTANIAIGMFTPPLGLNLIMASNITKLPMEELVPGSVPFFLVSIPALLIITYYAPISMFLPNLLYK